MTSEDPQAEVLAFLADPVTHGFILADEEVKRIDTHAASIFLAGNLAYKVKRRVRYPFLDFSTLEKRKAACEAELAVNRPFAPAIYRRVVAITRERDGTLALGGKGEPVEWAVEMARFDETATLDHAAARGELDLRLADALARVVASAHARAPVADAEAWPARLADYIAQNKSELDEHPELFEPAAVETLTRASRAALRRIERLLRERGEAGLVRRGHGDLHLGNIVLIDGKPVVFDAIEFDPLIATGDVLYDLAFLLMDLLERGLDAAANVTLNRYLAETRRPEDLDGLAALPLFFSLRAAIRAKVTAARLDIATPDDADAAAARDYFRLAQRLIAPPRATLIAIGGLSGTGKSTLAAALSPTLLPAPGAVVLRSDVERKSLFGVAETARLPASAYTADVTRRVYAALLDKARRVTAAGHTAIVDAVFAQPDERIKAAAAARAGGVAFRGLFLTTRLAARVARVEARPPDASDADAAVAREQESYDRGALDWTEIDASGSLDDTLASAQAALNSHAPRETAPR
ncbi:MAG TPA: AAA family ATPase [Xanthobacteraceae bacterium]|nr:AAA family ATPase [Xanthobacteraceae bacterium]